MRVLPAVVVAVSCVVPAAVPAHAATSRTLRFTGAVDERWSSVAADGTTNWLTPDGAPAVPADGDRLVFPAGLTRLTTRDDIPGLSVRSVRIAAPVVISGKTLTLADGSMTATGGGTVRIKNTLIALSRPAVAAFRTRLLLGAVELADARLTFGAAADEGFISVSGTISGRGSVRKTGPGRLSLGAENTFRGPTTVAEGSVLPASNRPFGRGAVRVETGAVLDTQALPQGRFTYPEPITLDGGTVVGRFFLPNVIVAAPSVVRTTGFGSEIGMTGSGPLVVSGENTVMQVESSPDYTGTVEFVGPAEAESWNFVVDANDLGGSVIASGYVEVNEQFDIAGSVTVTAPAAFEPAGTVSTADVDVQSGATLVMFVNSFPSALDVTGTVHLAGDLEIFGGVQIPAGQTATLIANDGTDPVDGVFAGLPEGSAVPGGATISYVGGDGNDVTVTKS